MWRCRGGRTCRKPGPRVAGEGRVVQHVEGWEGGREDLSRRRQVQEKCSDTGLAGWQQPGGGTYGERK